MLSESFTMYSILSFSLAEWLFVVVHDVRARNTFAAEQWLFCTQIVSAEYLHLSIRAVSQLNKSDVFWRNFLSYFSPLHPVSTEWAVSSLQSTSHCIGYRRWKKAKLINYHDAIRIPLYSSSRAHSAHTHTHVRKSLTSIQVVRIFLHGRM